MERFIKRMAVIFYIVFAFLSPAVSSHYDALSSNRHSERKEEFFVEKTGNGMVTRSEESITRTTSYRFPHHGGRSFTSAYDDD